MDFSEKQEKEIKVGIIGCGYVFDHYMSTWNRYPSLSIKGIADIDPVRLKTVAKAYNLSVFNTNEDLLSDPEIDIVANFTNIESHYEVTKAALLAGKHVYSEKPLTTDLQQARSLFDIAQARGLTLSCAPSNALSDTSQTLWKAVRDGAVGDVRIVYAEFDDNVIYLMHPETWRSPTGAPWPYLHEYEQGCTYEHVGYHLTWLCAIFGPVDTVTAFSKQTLPDKTDLPLNPSDTPDFSVACLNFKSGIVARVTCSIGVPYDHRMRIVGNKGMLSADTYRHYQCPVYLERFSQLTLNARKARSVRNSSWLQRIFGIGGHKVKLVRYVPPTYQNRIHTSKTKWLSFKNVLKHIKRSELGQQDKCIGIAELADSILTGRSCFPPHDFTLHLVELTIAIQSAGIKSSTHIMQTDFEPLLLPESIMNSGINYDKAQRQSLFDRVADKILIDMHKK
jgi:predicted dehydrogenase